MQPAAHGSTSTINSSESAVGVDRYEEIIVTRGSRSDIELPTLLIRFLIMYQHCRGSSQIGSQMDIFQRGKELELERKLRSIENQVGYLG